MNQSEIKINVHCGHVNAKQ